MLTTKQAAVKLHVTRRRVLALISSGRLPAKKVGRDWTIAEKAIALIKDRKPGRPAAVKQKASPVNSKTKGKN
jgi:excisionase family DNA binding protein